MNAVDNDLQEIYRQRVLEHSRNPHNCCHPERADREAQGFNPLCGDKVTVYLQVDSDHLSNVCFEGTGCAISIASASMMTDALQGQSLDRAAALIDEVGRMFSGDASLANAALGDLDALAGVRRYPSRIKCATLPWNTAAAALQGNEQQITTE